MLDKIKNLFTKKWVCNVSAVVLTIAVYSLIMLIFRPSFAEWVNSLTNFFVSAVITLIAYDMLEKLTLEARYKGARYWILFAMRLLAVSVFFAASIANTMASLLALLVASLVLTAASCVFHKFIYTPSTWTAEERMVITWDIMQDKAAKMGRDKFLEFEYGFRCYRTTDNKITSALDFDKPFADSADGDEAQAMTYNEAVKLGKTALADKIDEVLKAELDAAGITG